MQEPPAVVEISFRSVLKIVGFLLLLVLAWKIRFILISILVSYILMTGFAQLSDALHKRGVNKSIASIISYLILIGFFGILIFLILPPLVAQMRNFIYQMPRFIDEINGFSVRNNLPIISSESVAKLISARIDSIISNSVSFFFNAINVILSFFTVAVLSFYMLIERDQIKNNVFRLFPQLPKERVTNLAHKVEYQLGGWLKGELLLMFIIFVMTFVGLTLLKVEYALPLAVLAGLLEAVPVIGPILSAIPAVIITFTISPIVALGVVVLYVLIQQIENNLLVPKIMQGVIGINPLLTIVAILVGANLFGVVGAMLSVPVAAIIQLIIVDLVDHSKS